LIIGLLVGCGGAGTGASTTPMGNKKAKKTVAVEKAGMPWRAIKVAGGSEVSADELHRALSAASVICIGESHNNPHHHWAQLQLLGAIIKRQQAAGKTLALGMEMFQRPFQGILDDYRAGKIDESTMLSRSAWKDRWGFDYAFYRPMVRMAKERGLAILALNTARELTKKVSRKGVDSLTPEERKRLPELVLDDKKHRAWWDALMGGMSGSHGHGHGHGHGKKMDPAEAKARAERVYTAQVLWDETMADTAARWIKGGSGRQVIILAGNGHCHESGIVRRVERRGVGDAVSVHPIIDDGQGNVARLLAAPENDFLFVMKPKK
jgi:uncharacterized iron-regulated protein